MKKVSKYENKFAKLQKKAAEFNFRNQLKAVRKKEFSMGDEDKEVCIDIILEYLKSHRLVEFSQKSRCTHKIIFESVTHATGTNVVD